MCSISIMVISFCSALFSSSQMTSMMGHPNSVLRASHSKVKTRTHWNLMEHPTHILCATLGWFLLEFHGTLVHSAGIPWCITQTFVHCSIEFQQRQPMFHGIPAESPQGRHTKCVLDVPLNSSEFLFSLCCVKLKEQNLGAASLKSFVKRNKGWNKKEMTVIEMEHMGIPCVPK